MLHNVFDLSKAKFIDAVHPGAVVFDNPPVDGVFFQNHLTDWSYRAQNELEFSNLVGNAEIDAHTLTTASWVFNGSGSPGFKLFFTTIDNTDGGQHGEITVTGTDDPPKE